ncbi:DHA2 family efflux MFS transporter permease subunit [Nocardia brasiliensis]|uniref:DHA2 family efflux MFS transporter permease subunit n=1 Tax=Nocardia brasiliensis TaxID=37326 RepID=A0A6G9XP27_NOCBR|nr:MFS transporter [Nocardia brasiliensis]QIS02691.1 DHA2 family efflux MFS transporter permease subunit [Nocardia brasiliensis]
MTRAVESTSVLSTRRGKLVLALLCSIGFLDFMDAVIVNVALPSMQHQLGFSEQGLQWVATGYLLTYGGFMLLGGRAADLIGRRRVLVVGVVVFALASLVGGVANSAGLLVGARIVQGAGAALMMPAALSLVTTSFKEGTDRHRALGVWGGMIGAASAAGVLLGGVLTESFGWRSVLLINPIVCVLLLAAIYRLLPDDRRRAPLASFDMLGATLGTGGMLLLVYAVVEAPDAGWDALGTIARFVGAAVLLVAFLVNEHRRPNPLMPLSIFRIRGLAAADATQLIALAGFMSMFFFLSLYMQNVLEYSALKTGLVYLPVTFGIGIGAGLSTKLIPLVGTRPLIVGGSVVAAIGVFLLSGLPVDGDYVRDLLPGMMVMSIGLGFVMVSVTNAANAGVPADKAGLAASLLNSSQQLGGALGLAVLTTVATSHTADLMSAGSAPPDAMASGFSRALLASSIAILVAAVIGLRTYNTRSNDAPM